MTPIDLANLYVRLQQRISMHIQGACGDVSVMLPRGLHDELDFYRLVNWGYVLTEEAAKIPLAFLTRLPPLRTDGSLKKEIGTLRTYVAHNLDIERKRDQKMLAFAHRWFKDACGTGTPRDNAHYGGCCRVLATRLQSMLESAITASDALDDPTDGPRLIADLKNRIDLSWEAHRFDPLVEACAARLGNPMLDLRELRRKHLDKWRQTIAMADENDREGALTLQIEAALLDAIGNALPLTAQRASARLAIEGVDAVVAALLLLRDARQFGNLAVPEILERAYVAAMASAEKANATSDSPASGLNV
jgi:hypothetical protein